jgi:hypothetical protein
MGGIRIGGVSAVQVFVPPFALQEGTTGDGVDQPNLWMVQGAPLRLTPYTSPTCTPIPCVDTLWTPRLNPSRSLVAFWSSDPDDFEMSLYVIPTDGSATYPLSPTDRIWADGGVGGLGNYPAWNTDGDLILFTFGGPTLGGDVRQVTYTGGVETVLWTPAVQTPTQREAAYNPWLSPDGATIAFFVNFDSGGGTGIDLTRQGLWTMDADGSNDSCIDNYDDTNANGGYLFRGTQLAWSSDSEWIAYVDGGFGGGAGPGTYSVYKIRPDGSDKTLLKEGIGDGLECRIGWGAWINGDTQVLCTANSGASSWPIFACEADGSGDTEIVAGADGVVGSNIDACYQIGNRIYWVYQQISPPIVRSSALDGTDIQAGFTSAVGGSIMFGHGFERN